MKDVVIVSAKRTAIGAFGKGFLNVPAFELGAAVIEDALKAIDLDPNLVGSIIMGNVLQSGLDKIQPAKQPSRVEYLLINLLLLLMRYVDRE